MKRKICLVTEELAGVGRSGGIGAAFKEMALYLAGKGYRIDILYHDNEGEASDSFSAAQKFYTQHGIKLTKLDVQKYVDGEMSARAVSYAVYQFLKDPRLNYEFIHFHDYKGMGFFSCSAKHQRLAFDKTDLVVQIHGPTRWTIEANSAFFTHEDQLHIDYLERGSLRWADQLVAPSQYIAQWVNENFFPDSHKDIRVIKNLCRSLVSEIQAVVNESEASCEETADLSEIIIFGRHEDRKGISIACDALDHISDLIAKRGIKISFVGAPGSIFGQPSAIYFVEKAKKWKFPVNFHFGLNRSEAAAYLASSTNSLVVIPSPKENSPYTVLEALVLKKPILCSLEGGGAELVHPNDRHNACCLMTAEALAETIRGIIMHGLKPTRAAENLETIEDAWLSFHHHKTKEQRGTAPTDKPMVTVGITHFERPKKAIDALISILRQTYQNFEVIMVDDGSSTPETLESLNYIETLLSRVGGRMIRRENGYLGAARNSILKEARGQYILFLDDDDVAMPEMLEKLVQSALETRADVTTCLNVFMPEDRRGDVLSGGDLGGRVSYFPLGGPLALAPEQNVFGSATSLIRRQALDKINGYTELKNVGHEDYELYIRLAQAGATIVVCPEALFFYEVGRPSMISQTGMVRNFRRCFDALDMHSGSYPFSDYINLSAGQKIAINSHNRNWWINGQKETSSIRHKIMQCNNDIAAYLRLAADLAKEEGLPSLAHAFENGLSFKTVCRMGNDEEKIEDLVPIMGVSKVSRRRSEKLDHKLVDVRMCIALGRADDAIVRFSEYCEENPYLRPDVEFVLSDIVTLDLREADTSSLRRLVEALENCRVRRSKCDLRLSLLPVVVAAQDFPKLVGLLENIVSDDEREYASQYEDVAEAVENCVMTPLSHYIVHGQLEGRVGFAETIKATKVLGEVWKQKLSLEDFPALVKALKAGEISARKAPEAVQ